MQKFIMPDIKSNIVVAAEKRAKKKGLDKDILINAIIAYHDYLNKAGYILVYEGRRRKYNGRTRKRSTETSGNTLAVQQMVSEGATQTTSEPGYATISV